jgi:hypothetical protein
MSNFFAKRCALSTVVTTLLIAACAPEPSRKDKAGAIEGYVEDVNKLFVVDCLLPGQLRKLGSQVTYLTARRPVRTTAADCELRGGEYVAYDRANYATALKVWLSRAQEGDAAAQLYVGEIYEKGLGQPADFRAAAEWYRKSATQGNAQAQINLGHLYEKGLGVPKDPRTAISWYRKASGLESADLPFVGEVAAAERQELETLRQTTVRQREESEMLRGQLQSARERLLQQQDALRQAQEEIGKLRTRIRQEKSAPGRLDDARLRQLEGELRRKEAQLKTRQGRVSEMVASLSRERQAMTGEPKAARSQKPAPAPAETPKAAAGDRSAAMREKLAEVEMALHDKIAAYQEISTELTRLLTQAEDSDETRKRIGERKETLQNQAREISALRQQAEQYTRTLAELNKTSPEMLAQAGPRIEILQPAATLTRGVPVIRIGSGVEELVGKVEAMDGLHALYVNDAAQSVDAAGIFRAPIDSGRQDTVKIVAIDDKQKRTDLTVSLIRDTPGAAAAVPEPSLSERADGRDDIEFGRFYALIIGNNDYAAYPALRTAISDARSVDVVLRGRYGFTTKLLLNANRHAIMTALNEIHKRLTDKDNLLIYYAGHGEIDPATQSAYWLPVDAEAGNPANWISSQSITELLSIMPARHALVVADSCYSGALTSSAVAKLPDGMDESKRAKWLKTMVARKARTVLTSGGVKPVLDEGGGDHSIFANAFLRVLRSNQRILEDYDVFGAVSRQVRTSASQVGFEQIPQYAPLQHAGHEGSPFFFVPKADARVEMDISNVSSRN